MTFAMRSRGMSLEGMVVDGGIGLESIGHRIQVDSDSTRRPHRTKLETIAAEVADVLPFDGNEWASRSNEIYNDVKHADRAEADLDSMVESVTQNRLVFRTWIARRLGVADDLILKRRWLLEKI